MNTVSLDVEAQARAHDRAVARAIRRDHFASAALAGLLAGSICKDMSVRRTAQVAAAALAGVLANPAGLDADEANLARVAVACADALIAELEAECGS